MSILREIIVWIFQNCFFGILIGIFLIPPWVLFSTGNSIFNFLKNPFWNFLKFFWKIFQSDHSEFFWYPPTLYPGAEISIFNFSKNASKIPGRLCSDPMADLTRAILTAFVVGAYERPIESRKTPNQGYKRPHWSDYIVSQINSIYKCKHK